MTLLSQFIIRIVCWLKRMNCAIFESNHKVATSELQCLLQYQKKLVFEKAYVLLLLLLFQIQIFQIYKCLNLYPLINQDPTKYYFFIILIFFFLNLEIKKKIILANKILCLVFIY